MTPQELNAFTLFGLNLMGLWALYWWCWRPYFLDKYRQDLFAIRDQLFDEAAKFPGAFADPTYNRTRNTINGYIRYAHHTGPLNLLIGLVTMPLPVDAETSAAPSTSVAEPDAKIASCARNADTAAGMRAAHHVLLGHLFTGPIFFIALAIRLALHRRLGPLTKLHETRPFRALREFARKLGSDSGFSDKMLTRAR